MAPTTLSDFTVPDIDMIFAVSQQNLNEGLAEYIDSLGAQVSWAYDVDDQGTLSTPANPAKPNVTFSGTLASPIQPAKDGRVWIVDLSQSGAGNQVTFNLTFQDGATYTNHQTGHTFTQSAGTDSAAQWRFPFQVPLKLDKLCNKSTVPTWLQKQLATLNGQYGQVFDLSQVLLDMETLVSNISPLKIIPKGFNYLEWPLVLQATSQHFQTHSSAIFTTSPSVGYAMTHNGQPPKQSLPTFTPTAVDFVIVPSPQDYGGSSTLVFVLMTQNKPMPATPANAFTNVTLTADPKVTPGVALISSPLFLNFLQTDFASAGIGGAINKQLKSVVDENPGRVTWQLGTSDKQPTSSLSTPTANNGQTFISWTLPELKDEADYTQPGLAGTSTANSTSESNAAAAFSGFQPSTGYTAIAVTGTLSMSASLQIVTNPRKGYPKYSGWSTPQLDWHWTAYYALRSVNASNAQAGGGGIEFALDLAKSKFPKAPVSAVPYDTSESGVQEFIYDDLGPAIKNLPSTYKTEFKTLPQLRDFVFPGGRTFSFQDPVINDKFALYSTIKYWNPS